MPWKWLPALLAGASLFVLAACGSGGPDIYADPGTDPPPPITDPTITTSGSVSPREGSPDLVEVNVAGFVKPADAPPVTADDVTVIEEGVVQGITFSPIGEDTRAASDIVFVFDTTSSMGSALTSVQESIISFATFLDESGLDVRLGAVTFGDAFDTIREGSSRSGTGSNPPPGFDTSERPTFPLNDDIAAFTSFIDEESPRGGLGAAENALGALEFAYESSDWRPGAQKVLILITDVFSHNSTSYTEAGIDEPWIPLGEEELLSRLRGNATVHVISPEFDSVGDYTDASIFSGVSGTGGLFVDWDGSEFDLSTIPLAEVASDGFVVVFRGERDGTEKEVRVVIDNGGLLRGEFSIFATY